MKKKTVKKVHVIVKYFYPVAAGIETNILETYSVLAKKGWDVTLHTSKDILTEKNCLPDYAVYRGIKVKRYQFKWYGFFPKIDYKNADVIALHNFDIFPQFHILVYMFWLKLTRRKHFAAILTPHGGFNPEWSVFTPSQVLIKLPYHYTIGVLMINLVIDGMRAVSEWEKMAMLSKGVRKKIIKVISNGTEDEAYGNVDKLASIEIKKKVKSFGKYILQIGRIYPIKNYETTIRALASLPKDIKFVIVGPEDRNPEYPVMLRKLIASLGLTDRVIFFGTLRGTDKYYLIKHAQMMVHMAIWESYCNVVHEALSQGVICIVANNTALPLLIKDGINGYVVDTKDVDTLVKRITYVLKNKNTKKLQEMSKRNQKFGLEESWRNVSDKLDKWYSTLFTIIQ